MSEKLTESAGFTAALSAAGLLPTNQSENERVLFDAVVSGAKFGGRVCADIVVGVANKPTIAAAAIALRLTEPICNSASYLRPISHPPESTIVY